MSKLSLSALAERAESIVNEDLLQAISGGTDDDCHVEECTTDHGFYKSGKLLIPNSCDCFDME